MSTDSTATPQATELTRFLVLPDHRARELTARQRTDLIQYADPALVIITNPESPSRGGDTATTLDEEWNRPVRSLEATTRSSPSLITVDGYQTILATDTSQYEGIRTGIERERIDPAAPALLLTDTLEVSLDKTALDASISGATTLKETLPNALHESHCTAYCSTELPHSFHRRHSIGDQSLALHGCGGQGNDDGPAPVTLIQFTPDGVLTTKQIDPSRLGIKAVEGVGSVTRDRLIAAGYDTRERIASTDMEDLTELSGIGRKTATTIKQSAQAISNGSVVKTSDKPVPGRDPVFIDIETNGLTPSVTWLIGVLDGVNGNYMSFIETDNNPTGQAVQDFLLWLRTSASERTLVAWNGWNYDYPVLRKHILEFCPEFEDDWEAQSKRDLLRWARDFDNCTLPGRTNKLEDVAEALGYSTVETGLTGAAVARRYQRYLDEPSPETEPDWERHKRYCEDDVRALAHIYRAITAESRLLGSHETPDIEANTEQAGLFDAS